MTRSVSSFSSPKPVLEDADSAETVRAKCRAAALATFFTAAYLGLALPVLGLGIALQFLTPRVTLLMFAKAPVPGTVKTRLGKQIGEENSASLYAAFLQGR